MKKMNRLAAISLIGITMTAPLYANGPISNINCKGSIWPAGCAAMNSFINGFNDFLKTSWALLNGLTFTSNYLLGDSTLGAFEATQTFDSFLTQLNSTIQTDIEKTFGGNQSTFTNNLNAYKAASTPTCWTQQQQVPVTVNGKTTYQSKPVQMCGSGTSSTSLNSTDMISSPSQYQAAQNYTQNASGANIGIAAPNPNTAPTPASVQYTAYYSTQSAVQSNASNTFANNLAQRTPTGGPGNYAQDASPRSHHNSTYNAYAQDENFLNDILSIPIFGPMLATMHSVMATIQNVPKMLEGITNMNGLLAGLQTNATMVSSATMGQQGKQAAEMESSGMPLKKSAHQ